MRLLETEITIDAPPQTVWAVMDDLEHYPEWNNALPKISGRTTVGQRVTATLRRDNSPDREINPELTRIVGARALRWVGIAPPGDVFNTEHIFILEPIEDGTKTRLIHNEIFTGSAVEERWPGIDKDIRHAYNLMNAALKKRAEAFASESVSLHPAIGKTASDKTSENQKFSCLCGQSPVEIEVSEALVHNHLCGCSKCWKPEGAVFAQTAVVPAGSITVTAQQEKLEPVDDSQKVQRQRCKECGTHVFAKVSDPDHHFYGVEFVHPELSTTGDQPKIEFAGFVSSIIEAGIPATQMVAVRHALESAGIASYDAFSSELMDIIAWHQVKLKKPAS